MTSDAKHSTSRPQTMEEEHHERMERPITKHSTEEILLLSAEAKLIMAIVFIKKARYQFHQREPRVV